MINQRSPPWQTSRQGSTHQLRFQKRHDRVKRVFDVSWAISYRWAAVNFCIQGTMCSDQIPFVHSSVLWGHFPKNHQISFSSAPKQRESKYNHKSQVVIFKMVRTWRLHSLPADCISITLFWIASFTWVHFQYILEFHPFVFITSPPCHQALLSEDSQQMHGQYMPVQ